ncbi:MAG: S8 family serine peptidase [Deltaproteobacteria bacterium]|nr:S8 family serine peptidase [Deltaproteobacteria bacterium]
MHHIFFLPVLLSCFLALNVFDSVLAQIPQSPRIVAGANDHLTPAGGPHREAGQLVVKFRPGVPANVIEGLHASLGARVLKVQPLSGLHRLGFPDGADLAQILTVYRNSPLVEEAGYNYVARAFGVPNDTYYQPYQWNFYNTAGGIWAEEAWDTIANKGQGIIVAVIDTGVAYEASGPFVQAPDLNKNFVSPKDFYNNDDHPNDDNGHGTHVTGTIAQDTNNNLATAGIAYQASIMPLKVLGWDGSGSSDDLNEAIYHAVGNGARVINLSLGFPNTGSPDATTGQVCTEIPGLNAALQYAYDHNVVVVAASGNDGGSVVNCPAAYSTTIAVGATRFDGQRTSYSTGGTALDIVAPGGDPNADQNGDGYGDGILQVTFCYDAMTMALYYQLFGINLYTEFCSVFYAGTSMATPHVTGTVALMLGENPGLNPDQVRNYLESATRDYGASGWDSSYGWGLLQAGAAVLAAKEGTTPPPPPLTGSLQGIVTDAGNGAFIGGAKITASNGASTFTTTSPSNGSYSFNGLACGSYDVTASAKTYASQTKAVQICIQSTLNFALMKRGKGKP